MNGKRCRKKFRKNLSPSLPLSSYSIFIFLLAVAKSVAYIFPLYLSFPPYPHLYIFLSASISSSFNLSQSLYFLFSFQSLFSPPISFVYFIFKLCILTFSFHHSLSLSHKNSCFFMSCIFFTLKSIY